MAKCREILDESSFRESLEELGVDRKRLDAVMEAITFTAARTPEYFPRVRGTPNLRRITVGPALGIPRLRIWFVHDEEKIWLRLAELDDNDDDTQFTGVV